MRVKFALHGTREGMREEERNLLVVKGKFGISIT